MVTVLSIEGGGEYAKIAAVKPPITHHFRGRYGGNPVTVGDPRQQIYSVQPKALKPVADTATANTMPENIRRLIEGN